MIASGDEQTNWVSACAGAAMIASGDEEINWVPACAGTAMIASGNHLGFLGIR